MYKGKKILAIIPARCGSKGIKDKNIKSFCGKPLISYTISEAIKSNIFDDIVVSTDSEEYANISKKYGATVPFLRKKELAGDKSSTYDVIVDVIHNMENIGKEYDYFILLQPTSPLRKQMDIINAINLVIEEDMTSCVSVCKVKNDDYLKNTLENDLNMHNFLEINKENMRRQENKDMYKVNGAIYISRINEYIKSKSFYTNKSKAYIMKEENSIDIDTELEFFIGEVLMKKIEEEIKNEEGI